ncbi:MAG: AbrB/MazE/SpoVT family DNA-binding domain-containing protein [Candidatus Omnitrophota bacterium]
MTITMTAKHQVTIPKAIVNAFGLEKGSLLKVDIRNNRIELIPLEPVEKVFTEKEYKALGALSAREKGKEEKITEEFIKDLKKGKK